MKGCEGSVRGSVITAGLTGPFLQWGTDPLKRVGKEMWGEVVHVKSETDSSGARVTCPPSSPLWLLRPP